MELLYFLIFIVLVIYGIKQCIKTFKENIELKSDLAKIKNEVYNKNKTIISLKSNIDELKQGIKEKDELYAKFRERSDNSIDGIINLYNDFVFTEFKLSERILKSKKHPALKEAKRIKELMIEAKKYNYLYKIMLYKYEYLLDIFPELTNYLEDFQSLSELKDIKSINHLEDDFDRVENYISKEEYLSKTETERNQLALDNYKTKFNKTKWQIGRDYELFCGQYYENKGWKVDYFGMEKKLNDLGRDLVAKKEDVTLIIQCKYWSKNKQIHEKHILQLYGTTIIEKLTNKDLFSSHKPVFITNTNLSERAIEFAKILDVKIVILELEDYPMIKCNINKDENGNVSKIYHLPFDQKYDYTQIKNPDEFYAYTVEEAEKRGFRRAFKYSGYYKNTI